MIGLLPGELRRRGATARARQPKSSWRQEAGVSGKLPKIGRACQGDPDRHVRENPDAAAGTDYLRLPDDYGDDFQTHWQAMRLVLEDADHKLTRQEILADWPADFPRPQTVTLWRWLQRAVARGLLCGEGSGSRSDPFRYWLAYIQDEWRERDPGLCELHDLIAAANRPHFEQLEKRRQPHRRDALSPPKDLAQEDERPLQT